jgi:DNA-binding MarR family transcriptional regulator
VESVKSAQGLALALALAALLAALPAVQASPPEGAETDAADCLVDVSACAQASGPLDEGADVPEAPPKDSGPSVLDGAGAFFAVVGAAIADGAAEAVGAVGDAFVGIGQGAMALLGGLAAAILILRPDGMPVVAFAGTAAGGTAVVAGGTQTGLWYAWRRWGALLASFVMPLFSRIQKDEVLDHEKRAQIFELIKQRPGVHLSEISRSLDLAWGSTLHHLRKLREQRLIQIKKNGHHKCYFLNGSGYTDAQMDAVSLLKNQTLADVAAAIEAHPDSSLKAISQALGISPPLTAHHVKTLEKAGLIRKERAGREVRIKTSSTLPPGFFNGLAPHACAAEGAVGFA